MVKSAQMGKEISVTVINKIGVLADMAKILSERGVNIEAVVGYAAERNQAVITFICDDQSRAVDELKKRGYKSIEENEVVILDLENKPGALKTVTTKLATANIDIKYIYGTTCACASGCPARIVLSSEDNEKALVLFSV